MLRKLGEGKFGRCYLARDKKDRQKYVLKVIRAVKRYVENSKVMVIYRQDPGGGQDIEGTQREGDSEQEEADRQVAQTVPDGGELCAGIRETGAVSEGGTRPERVLSRGDQTHGSLDSEPIELHSS